MTENQQTGTTAGEFNWDELLPAADAPAATYAVGAQTDPLTLPEPIRLRVEESLHQTMEALKAAKAKGTKVESVPPQWKLQRVSGVPMGDAMVKAMRKYASYRPEKDIPGYHTGDPAGQITVRCAVVIYGTPQEVAKDAKLDKDKRRGVRPIPRSENGGPAFEPGVYVRYAAKPLETRKAKDAK